MQIRSLIPAFALVAMSACVMTAATPVRITSFGWADPEKDETLTEVANSSNEVPEGIKIARGVLPEGLSLSDNGSKLIVAPGFEKKYEALGQVTAPGSAWSTEPDAEVYRAFKRGAAILGGGIVVYAGRSVSYGAFQHTGIVIKENP